MSKVDENREQMEEEIREWGRNRVWEQKRRTSEKSSHVTVKVLEVSGLVSRQGSGDLEISQGGPEQKVRLHKARGGLTSRRNGARRSGRWNRSGRVTVAIATTPRTVIVKGRRTRARTILRKG